MAAAVAKAPEENKVPENPQVLCNSSFHNGRGELPTLNLPKWPGLKPFPCLGHVWYWHLFLRKNETVYENHHRQKTKTKYRTLLPNSLTLFKPTCQGRKKKKKTTTGFPTSDLENTEDKIWIKNSCCSWSQDGGVLTTGRAMTAHESCVEHCLSHLWLFSATYTVDVSKPQCMFCILKDYCSHLQKT